MSETVTTQYIEMDLDTEDFDGLKYHKTNFNKGVSDSSYLAGVITSLLNTGLDKNQVENIVCCVIKNGLLKKE